MPNVEYLFRIDIGFNKDYGWAAGLTDIPLRRSKYIRGNSIEQLLSRIRNVVKEEAHKKRNFPVEAERGSIITPDSNGW